MANELVKYLAAEFRRLAYTGEKHGPVIVYDTPANVNYVPPRYRNPPMSTPPCLCGTDTAAGIARRFAHARDLLGKLQYQNRGR